LGFEPTAEFVEGGFLDLTDAFAGDLEPLANFFERTRSLTVEAVTKD
jgi:hypothetical protein